MSARWRSGWLAAVVAVAVALAPGCSGAEGGGDAGAGPTVRAVVRAALVAVRDRDAEALCETLSRKGTAVVGYAQHGSPPHDCPLDVERYLGALRPYGNGFRPSLVAVSRPLPGRAIALFRLPDGMRGTIELRRERGVWKLDGLFDADLAYMQLKLAGAAPRPVPEKRLLVVDPPAGLRPSGGVTVRDGASGRRCAPVDAARYPEFSGGCVLRLAGAGVRISLQTPFGFMQFAHCQVSHKLRIDSRGRAWVEDYLIGGDSPCLDLLPCRWGGEGSRRGQRGLAPWPARLERGAGGRLVLTIDEACFDTCIGRVSGRWRQDLVPGGEGLRLRSDSMVGTSGWRVDGVVSSRRGEIAIGRSATEPAPTRGLSL